MSFVLPPAQEKQSFGSKLGAVVGQGLSQGVQKSSDFAQQMMMERAKRKEKLSLLSEFEKMGNGGSSGQSFADKVNPQKKEEMFIKALPEIEQKLGKELTTEDLGSLWKEFSSEYDQHMSGNQYGSQDPFAKSKAAAAIGEHDLSKVFSDEAKLGEKIKEDRRKEKSNRAYELAKPTLEEASKSYRELPQKEMALQNMVDAIEGGDLGVFGLDSLADLTGIDALRTPKGAAFKTSSKEYFLGNLSRVGAKGLNQWMEKVVQEMAPQIGQSKQANLAMTEILRAENDVTRKFAELTNQIAEEYENKTGEIPRNLSQLVERELSPYAVRRQEEAKKEIERLEELYSPVNKEGYLMYDPRGNLRRVSKKDVADAKKEGYRIKK